jgi:hypothetical protein
MSRRSIAEPTSKLPQHSLSRCGQCTLNWSPYPQPRNSTDVASRRPQGANGMPCRLRGQGRPCWRFSAALRQPALRICAALRARAGVKPAAGAVFGNVTYNRCCVIQKKASQTCSEPPVGMALGSSREALSPPVQSRGYLPDSTQEFWTIRKKALDSEWPIIYTKKSA